jgi:hypothetical protein
MGLKLTDEQKAFIVKGYARFEGTGEVCRSFKEKYNAELSPSHALAYNPSGVNFHGAQKWLTLFERTRKNFIENTQDIGITTKSFRLQELHKLYGAAVTRKNVKLATEILEQAAKEMGEVFTNKREIKSDVRSVTATMTTDELRNEILNDLNKLGIEPPATLQIGLVRDTDKDDGTKH